MAADPDRNVQNLQEAASRAQDAATIAADAAAAAAAGAAAALSVATAGARDAAAAAAADAAAIVAERAAERAATVYQNIDAAIAQHQVDVHQIFKKNRLQQLGAFLLLAFVFFYVIASLHSTQVKFQVSRVKTFNQACQAINTNGAAINKQNRYLASIVLNGAKASKLFPKTAGVKSYSERLKLAEQQSAQIIANGPKALDCAATERIIRRDG